VLFNQNVVNKTYKMHNALINVIKNIFLILIRFAISVKRVVKIVNIKVINV